MITIEPSSRTTAQSLSDSIINLERKLRQEAEDGVFCGECCYFDHNIGTASEEASDDEVWEREFRTNVTVPASSRQAMDDIPQSGISSSHSLEPSIRDRSIPDMLLISTMHGQSPEYVTQVNVQGIQHPRKSSTEVLDTREERGRASVVPGAQESSNNRIPSPSESRFEEFLGRYQKFAETKREDNANWWIAAQNYSQDLVKRIVGNYNPPPTWDTGFRLPCDLRWKTPKKFLDSATTDEEFNGRLEKTDPVLYSWFRNATTRDLIPVMHIFLRNGFRSNLDQERGILRFWHQVTDNAEIFKLLIAYPLSVGEQYRDRSRHFPLHPAYGGNDYELIQLLFMACGPCFKLGINSGLSDASIRGPHRTVHVLILNGVNCYILYDQHGWLKSPAMLAAEYGHLKVLKVFIERGNMDPDEDCEVKHKEGDRRLIHAAAARGFTEVVEYLIAKGANPLPKAKTGRLNTMRTPAEFARKNGHRDTAYFITQYIEKRMRGATWRVHRSMQ